MFKQYSRTELVQLTAMVISLTIVGVFFFVLAIAPCAPQQPCETCVADNRSHLKIYDNGSALCVYVRIQNNV